MVLLIPIIKASTIESAWWQKPISPIAFQFFEKKIKLASVRQENGKRQQREGMCSHNEDVNDQIKEKEKVEESRVSISS